MSAAAIEQQESSAISLEKSFLGGIVVAAFSGMDQDVLAVLPDVHTDHFYLPKHREIARAVVESFQEAGDLGSIGDTQRLFRRLTPGTFDQVEDLDSYLLGADAAADLPGALGAVKDAHTRRSLRRLLRGLDQQLGLGHSTPRVIESAVAQLTGLIQEENRRTSGITYVEAMRQTLEKIEENMRAVEEGRTLSLAGCGIEVVDESLGGGIGPGELAILAARPGLGKTAFALQWIINAVETKGLEDPNAWGAIVSMEMTFTELIMRDFAAETGIDTRDMKRGRINRFQLQQLKDVVARLESCRNIIIHENVATIDDAIAALRADRVRMGQDPVMVMTDYLGLFDLGKESNGMNQAAAIGRVTRSCKVNIAKGLNTPHLLLCQLNREVENRGSATASAKPRLSDLRDSGSIEQDANMVAFLSPVTPLEREVKTDPTRDILFVLAKKRDGSLDEVELEFVKKRTRFRAKTGTRETQSYDTGQQVGLPGVGTRGPAGVDMTDFKG